MSCTFRYASIDRMDLYIAIRVRLVGAIHELPLPVESSTHILHQLLELLIP
jgi:hypothetical protein